MIRAGGVAPGAAPGGEAVVVHGIAFEGQGADEAAVLTRKVLFISKLFVILTTVEAVQDCLLGNTQDTFGWLIISLAMPYCGYYGAKNRDRNLLSMFYSVNLVLSIMYVMWILLMLMILSMVDSAVATCNECHALTTECGDPHNARAIECAQRGIECGPVTAAPTTGENFEQELEEDEEQDFEHGRQQQQPRSACQAWYDLSNDREKVYLQMLTCLGQIILACGAFSYGRRLAAHSYFMGLEGPPAMRRVQQQQQQHQQATRRSTGPVLQAKVVQPVSFEPESVLAPGEVMAGVVRVQCNPVSGSHTPTPQAPIVMATPLATRHMDDDI